ncbi:MAG: hypothetical protein INR72_14345 [Williamsia herbipolensis]|nr:hypothetical protein [Williamsia herbipolensis]
MNRRSRLRLAVAALASAVALSTVAVSTAAGADTLPSPAPLLQRTPDLVTGAPLPTIQLDSGYVWAQTTIGTTVYAGGSFSNAREAGKAAGAGALSARSNLLAYDITTGALLPFAPQVNGVIKSIAASPDGKRIYIGGSFSSVNGQPRYNIAALDAATGALVPGFSASIGGTGVYTLTATDTTVYAGGLFTQASGAPRKNLAAFSTAGSLLAWAPTTDLQVDASVMDPTKQKVIVGGRFATVNGAAQRGLAALDPATGAILPWAVPASVQNGVSTGSYAGKAGIFSLTADANAVYGTGWVRYSQAGNLEGTFAAEAGTGNVRWIADCHGDHYGVYSTGKVVYTTSHVHACESMGQFPGSTNTYKYAEAYTTDVRGILGRPQDVGVYKDWSGTPSPAAYNWYPDFTVGTATGLGQAGLSVTGTGDYISIGGEFGTANNKQFQGLVRFATAPTGEKAPPRLSTGWSGTVTSQLDTVKVSIPANWDRDDKVLSYDLYREGVTTPVATTTAESTWWSRPTVSLQVSGLTPGSTQRFRVVARDADGNSATSDWMTKVVGG